MPDSHICSTPPPLTPLTTQLCDLLGFGCVDGERPKTPPLSVFSFDRITRSLVSTSEKCVADSEHHVPHEQSNCNADGHGEHNDIFLTDFPEHEQEIVRRCLISSDSSFGSTMNNSPKCHTLPPLPPVVLQGSRGSAQQNVCTRKRPPKRPMNSFMRWAKTRRRVLAVEHPELENASISTLLGQEWKLMSPADKQPFREAAEAGRRQHRKDFPDFKYKKESRVARIMRQCRENGFDLTRYSTDQIDFHAVVDAFAQA